MGLPGCAKDATDPAFNRQTMQIFKKFCEQVGEDPGTDLIQVVDELGDAISHKDKRDDNPYQWTFGLSKSQGKGECWYPCDKYFTMAFTQCGKLGDDKKSLAEWGGIQTGCGQYKFVVIKPAKPKPKYRDPPLPTPSCVPKPTTAPYQPGTCSFNALQTEVKDTKASHKYTIQITMKDNGGTIIGEGTPDVAGEGGSSDAYFLNSKLEDKLEVQPNTDHHGMLYFYIGDTKWDTVGGRSGKLPYCSYSYDDTDANGFKRKDYDCYFSCQWGGGISSDEDPNKYCK